MDPDRFEQTDSTVPADGTLTIIYENGAKPNETITVAIDNGETGTDSVQITLDASGHGSIEWTVPTGWTAANINGPNSAEHSVTVMP